MKKLITIIISLHASLLALHVSAQWGCTCLPEGITFSSQAAIDSFRINYTGCTEILGNVEINGGDVTNLLGLSVLLSVGGDLRIEDNDALSSLTGLDNLTSVSGSLSIIINDSLTSIAGLGNIDAASLEDLSIYYNPVLSDCAVQAICDYLASPTGVVSIFENDTGCNNPPEVANSCGFLIPCLPFGNYNFINQADIDSFQAYYPGCHELEGNVVIGTWGGSNIFDLNGLNSVTKIGGELRIFENPLLKNLNGLNNIHTIKGNFYIFYNDSLISLSGLDSLKTVDGDLGIGMWDLGGNPFLRNLDGLEQLGFIGGDLWIFRNDSLVCLSGLDNLDSIGGRVNIGWNSNLKSVSGMENLIYIGGDLTIGINWHGYPAGNPSLLNLNGFDKLESIEGGLTIQYNNSLQDITGLANLSSIGGDLTFANNDALSNLSGLDNITSIEGGLGIYFMYQLNSLSGLDNVEGIGGDLDFMNTYNLASLTGLNNVTYIGGSLFIGSNSGLTSLSGLDNISAGSIQNLTINENHNLSACEVQSICDYLASPGASISIYDNAPGCNSQEEVEQACGLTSVQENSLEEMLVIAPNPAHGIVDCRLSIACPEGGARRIDFQSIILKIFDLFGREVRTLLDETKSPGEYTVRMDVSDLPAGVYLVRVQAGEQRAVRKLVVQ